MRLLGHRCEGWTSFCSSMPFSSLALRFLAHLTVTLLAPQGAICWTVTDSCEEICSPSDDYTTGHWERIADVTPVFSAQQLERLAGYTNHSHYHLGNWEAHFCGRRPVLFATFSCFLPR